MNWTGGRLSRHSRNAKGSLTQRQKQHFAKARSNLLNGPQKRSPIKWSIFDSVDGGVHGGSLKLSTTPRSARHRSQDQSEFGLNDHGSSRKRHRLGIRSEPASPEATFPGNTKSGQGREPYDRLLVEGESDRYLCHKTPSPLHAEVGNHQSTSVETVDDMDYDCEANSLEERRRRLLGKIDWVGAKIQHPIKLRFTVSGNDERLGKRRRVTARHQRQFGAIAQPMITSPFAKPRFRQKNITNAPARNHVRISIGGRHVPVRVTSSTSQSKTVGGRFISPQASTSDEMLLDGYDMSRQHRQPSQEGPEHLSYPAFSPLAPLSASPRDLPIHTPHRKAIIPNYARPDRPVDRLVTATLIDLKGQVPTAWTRQDNSALDVALQFEEHSNNVCDPRDQHIGLHTKSRQNLATLRGHCIENLPSAKNRKYDDANPISNHGPNFEAPSSNADYMTDVSRQLSESARKLHSVAQDKSRRNVQLDSRPQLLHPIPLTSRTSRVLRSTSSEAAGSTVAQICVSKPIPTPSQVLDEEIWKTWVLSSQDSLRSNSDNGEYDDVSISPGISNLGCRFAQEGQEDREDKDGNDTRKPPEVSLNGYTSGEPFGQSGVESPAETEERDDREVTPQIVQECLHHEHVAQRSQVVDYKDLFLPRVQNRSSPPKEKPVQVENPDEAWMKFILSDDDIDHDEDPRPFGQRRPTSPTPNQPLESSVIAHPSTQTASSSQSEIVSPSPTGTIITPSNISLNISNQATQGSNSSSDALPRHPPPPLQPSSQQAFSFSTPVRPIRKLTFTKPPRFPSPIPRGSSPETSATAAATAGSPIHIGRGLSKRAVAVGRAGLKDRPGRETERRMGSSGGGGRERGRRRVGDGGGYSLVRDDYEDEEVESIEDD